MSTADLWIFGGAIASLIGVAFVIRASIKKVEDIVPPRHTHIDDSNQVEVSRINWSRVPAAERAACIEYLKRMIPSGVLMAWKEHGLPDGFHFTAGMAVRNYLRHIIRDDELPPVQYSFGMSQNWDDHYMGALHELLEKL